MSSLLPQHTENPTEEHIEKLNMTFNNRQETWGKTDYK